MTERGQLAAAPDARSGAPLPQDAGALAARVRGTRFAGTRAFVAAFSRQWLGMAGLFLMLLVIVAAAFAPWIAPYSPSKIAPLHLLQPPGHGHLLGTDGLGRDVFSRLVYGARVSLYSGFLVVSVSMIGGTLIGLVAGYVGGFIDALLMRTMDALLAFPGLVLALAIASALGPNLTDVMIAIAVLSLPGAARIARGETLSLRGRDFIVAERVVGASPPRILFLHVLPNALPPIVVIASLRVGSAVLIETGLSFLGLGVQPPTPSWGTMVNEGAQFLEHAPWIALASGGAIFLTVLGANFVGDSVRDVLDPRLRNAR